MLQGTKKSISHHSSRPLANGSTLCGLLKRIKKLIFMQMVSFGTLGPSVTRRTNQIKQFFSEKACTGRPRCEALWMKLESIIGPFLKQRLWKNLLGCLRDMAWSPSGILMRDLDQKSMISMCGKRGDMGVVSILMDQTSTSRWLGPVPLLLMTHLPLWHGFDPIPIL